MLRAEVTRQRRAQAKHAMEDTLRRFWDRRVENEAAAHVNEAAARINEAAARVNEAAAHVNEAAAHVSETAAHVNVAAAHVNGGAAHVDFAAVVDEVYRAVLLRPADDEALGHWKVRLAQSPNLIGDFLRGLLSSDEFAQHTKRFINAYVDPEKLPFVHDNSQNGEVSMLLRELIDRSGVEPYVVDVGAYRRSGSNSYDLMRYFGWRGLLIEANPHLHEGLKAEFKGLDYTLTGVAAALEEGTATLYLGVHDEISSIHRGNTAMWGDVEGSIDVRAAKLSTILSEHDVPKKIGLMSIDCECDGFDLLEDVLEHGYAPQWVIIEVFEGLKVETLDMIAKSDATKKAYRIVGRTFPNLLLERVKE